MFKREPMGHHLALPILLPRDSRLSARGFNAATAVKSLGYTVEDRSREQL